MSTFALIHGAGDVGWYWHLVEAELRTRGHDTVAPDLPADDESATLTDYADAVVDAVGGRTNLVVVGQSFGGFTAPLVANRLPVDVLVLVAGMVPAPGEAPRDWWSNTGYAEAVRTQAPVMAASPATTIRTSPTTTTYPANWPSRRSARNGTTRRRHP